MKKIRSRLFGAPIFGLISVVLMSPVALADDEDDVRAVIDTYIATEVVDLERQASLMSGDRVFINGGLRQTDNVANMKSQMANMARNRELDPDAQVIVTAEDVMVRVIGGNAAVASFYRYWNVINSADAVRAGVAGGGGPPPAAVTLVLAKMGGDWKIVHTHQSNIGG